MYSRLAICISFVLFALALFVLPRGLAERLKWGARLFTTPGMAIAQFTTRVTREAVGGLPPQMTASQRDALLMEAAGTRTAIARQNDAMANLRNTNRELQRLLRHTTGERSHTMLAAQIVRMSPFDRRVNAITIDRGAYDGVQGGQAVQTLDGVIGVVGEVMAHQATVRLLLAPDATMPVQVLGRNVSALLENRGGVLYMTSVMGTNFAAVQAGDRIYTTDLGSEAMVAGQRVGQVTAVQRGEDGAPIYVVEPAATLGTEHFVLVSIPSGQQ